MGGILTHQVEMALFHVLCVALLPLLSQAETILGHELIDRALAEDVAPFTISLREGLGFDGIYESAEFYARGEGEIIISLLTNVTFADRKKSKVEGTIVNQVTVQAIAGANTVPLSWEAGPDDLITFTWTNEPIIPFDKSKEQLFNIQDETPVLGESFMLNTKNRDGKRVYSVGVTATHSAAGAGQYAKVSFFFIVAQIVFTMLMLKQ